MSEKNYLKGLDYSVLQQCMHCGMCLPTCPTYRETGLERNSPRGRIALMRAIADDELAVTRTFGKEMYYCLGCLACVTACPAGVDYATLFERSRAQIEAEKVLDRPTRRFWRYFVLRRIFLHPRILRFLGASLRIYQRWGVQSMVRRLGLTRLLPADLRRLEPNTPEIAARFSNRLIREVESPPEVRHRVALLTGCVQDLLFSEVNRDTADVLLAAGCEVHTPPLQPCCGSLHAHNGDWDAARILARRNIDCLGDLERLDAIISNAGGCGSHLKHYHTLLADDPTYSERAAIWDQKLKDIHEWLDEIELPTPPPLERSIRVTYHDSCHLVHGQRVARQPRELLARIPGVDLIPLEEASWCCGSAGIYSITQPEQAAKLQQRKIDFIVKTGAELIVTANPGCVLQIQQGLQAAGQPVRVVHPVSLLAMAFRGEQP